MPIALEHLVDLGMQGLKDLFEAGTWLSSAAAALPPVYTFSVGQSRGGLRASLVELGELLTGDAARAALAFERAFALA